MRKLFDFLRAIDPLVHLVFVVAIALLVYGYLSLSGRLEGVSGGLETLKNQVGDLRIFPKIDFEELTESPKPSSSPVSAEALVSKPSTSQLSPSAKKSITYLDLGSLFTTTSVEWVNVNGSDVYIDVEKEYGKEAYVDWEGSTRVSDQSGKAYIRLYDVTNSIAVNSSELSTSNTASTRVSSPRLYLWAGHNLYRVQIKSTAPYTATFDSGRVKIVY